MPHSRVFVFNDAVVKAVALPFDTEGYLFANRTLVRTTSLIGADVLDRAESIYDDTYRRIKVRDNWAVPTESGFCFDGGVVAGPSTYSEEVSQSFALMPGRPALLVIKLRDAVDVDLEQPLTRNLRMGHTAEQSAREACDLTGGGRGGARTQPDDSAALTRGGGHPNPSGFRK